MKNGRLCASISATECDEMARKSKLALSLGADLVELRLDHLRRPALDEILDTLSDFFSHAVVTVRSREEGGRYNGGEQSRVELVNELALHSPALVDVELQTLGSHTRFLNSLVASRTIVSWHDLEGTPALPELRKIAESAASYGGLVKIVTTARATDDPPRVLSLYQSVDPGHLIAFCTGDLGVGSRISALKLGSPLMYCSLPSEPLAPGQLTVTEMRRVVGQSEA